MYMLYLDGIEFITISTTTTFTARLTSVISALMRVRRSPHDATSPILSVHCHPWPPYPSYPYPIALSKSSLICHRGRLRMTLLPATFKFLQALTQSSTSFRSTCPNHLNQPHLITSTTPSIPCLLSSTMRTLSLNVTPHVHRVGTIIDIT